ncbi:MAG: hypothetical protein JW929_05445 [Anaerolineales bacterium]|nr:hypothetical protein [Anaerolineales bacterium]
MPVHCSRGRLWIGLAVLFLAAISPQTARADIGPKPTMKFEIVYEISPAPGIVAAVLEQCSDPNCSSSSPFTQGGPAHFTCSWRSCDSLGYSYSEYQRLKFSFSDGKTRLSNVFTKRNYYARYEVAVRENDLLVTERAGEIEPFFSVYWFLLGGAVLLAAGFLVSIVLLIVIALRGRAFEESRKVYLAAWILSLPTAGIVLLASLFSGMIIVLLAEAVIAILYAALRKRSMALVLTVVFLLTVVKAPVFAFVAGFIPPETEGIKWILLSGLFFCLLDAGVLGMALRKTARFPETLLFALANNVPYWVMGLISIILRLAISMR